MQNLVAYNAFMSIRNFAAVLLPLAIASIAFGQAKNEEIANMEKVIAQCKEVESRLQKLYSLLDTGAVVMVTDEKYSQSIPMRASEIRDHFFTTYMMGVLSNPNPNIEEAVTAAKEHADKYIASRKDESRKRKALLPDEISQVRLIRLKTEKSLQAAKKVALESKSSSGFGGTWTSNWGDMMFTQSGSKVSGTYEHLGGKIEGTVEGDGQLHFTWTQTNGHGIGVIKIDPDGKTFSGTWNYTDDSGTVGSGGTWTGTRK